MHRGLSHTARHPVPMAATMESAYPNTKRCPVLLGLDVGTTAVKALLVSEEGVCVAEAGVEYGLSHPRPGWCEQNAEDWWRCLVAATRQAVARLAGEARFVRSPVRALALSTQGDTMVPVDADGRPLAPARTWMDQRTADLIPALEERLPPETWYEITGATLGPYAAALTIPWLRRNLPEVYRRTARFSLVADFLVQRLTGAPALDHPNASRTVLFDLRARRWAPALLEAVEVEEARLSPTLPSGTVAGELTAAAAEELGLATGTPVALGGHDQTCAAVGAGVVRPGSLLLSCGTAWVLLAALNEPLLDRELRRAQTYCHAAPDRWALLTAHAGGNVLAWVRDTLYGGGVTYDEITAEALSVGTGFIPSEAVDGADATSRVPTAGGQAEEALRRADATSRVPTAGASPPAVPVGTGFIPSEAVDDADATSRVPTAGGQAGGTPGQAGGTPALLLLPHFYGSTSPEWMRPARGALLGLTLSHSRGQVALAALQGVALEVARNLQALREMSAQTEEIRMIGGGARSALWAQIVADATGATVVRPQVREAAAYGAALLAGVGAGLLPPVDELTATLPVRDRFEPDEARAEEYREMSARFGEACEALRGTWERL